MNFYNDNMTIPYYEENIPKNKKKIIKIFIIIFIILILIIIGILFLVSLFNKNKSNNNLNNIIIENNIYEPNFSNNIYEYYLLTEDKEITINCKSKEKLNGCGKKIDLSNYSSYIHEIIDNDKVYKIYIKHKETNTDTNIVIDSIEGISNDWTNSNQTITINVKDSKNLEYSFDNGLTYQKDNKYVVDENKLINLVIKDNQGLSHVHEININNIDKTLPEGIIIKETSTSNKITLKVIAKDEESGIDGYSWNNSKYSNDTNYTISKKGTYSVKIKDKAGNVKELSITIKDSDFNTKRQVSVTLYKNGATSIESDILSCTKINGKCTVTLPNITKENGKVIGWSTDQNSKTSKYKVNEKIEISKDIKLYAITKKDVEVNFMKNGANSISSSLEKCTIYNNEQTCDIKVPTITHNNAKIIGWNENKDIYANQKSSNNILKVSDNKTFYALVYEPIVISFKANGADNLENIEKICYKQLSSDTCIIETPDKNTNSTLVGWSTNKDDLTYEVLPNHALEVDSNETYYAITKKTVTITFIKNGADSISSQQETCTFYNNEKSCIIKTPSIKRKDSVIIGWSTNKNSKTKEINQSKEIIVSNDKTYYAITKKDVVATFNANGADKIGKTMAACTYYNDENGCIINMPSIKRNDYEVLGWGTNSNSTQEVSKQQSNYIIKESGKYYAITYRTVKATYHINNADKLGNCTNPQTNGCIETCNIYNTNKSCAVKVPYIYSTGNEVQFFSTSSDPTTLVGYTPARNINILNNVTLYAIVDNRYRDETLSIKKEEMYNYTSVETESSCSQTITIKYHDFLDRLYVKAPYLFTASKITFIGENKFNEIWGNYAGMTYGSAVGYRSTDIKCPKTYSEYYLKTIVHELAHTWDSYYFAKTGEYLSTTEDFRNLYNKYRYQTTRPLREYSYTNINEFIADSYSWYYFLYIDKTIVPSTIKENTYYPNDLKIAMEKYIKKAKNNYK